MTIFLLRLVVVVRTTGGAASGFRPFALSYQIVFFAPNKFDIACNVRCLPFVCSRRRNSGEAHWREGFDPRHPPNCLFDGRCSVAQIL